MNDADIGVAVDQAYKKKYPQVTNTSVRHVVREMLPGALVVVVCTEMGQGGLSMCATKCKSLITPRT
jgi:hypothetical protein